MAAVLPLDPGSLDAAELPVGFQLVTIADLEEQSADAAAAEADLPPAGKKRRKRKSKAERLAGRPKLKPGQRRPTKKDDAEASKDCFRFQPGAGFPEARRWKITARHVKAWQEHNFWWRRGDTNRFRVLGDLSEDEFADLLWDLDCYADLRHRGLISVSLPEYLRPGREEWGWIGDCVFSWLEGRILDGARIDKQTLQSLGVSEREFFREFEELLDPEDYGG